ncbi:MAG: hypothetical protein PHV07_08790 [Oscillospiraceae bacterium]|nr:hypothetical protein [Oscillospiraceae bacterium]
MRDYQKQINNPYYLPRSLYNRVLYIIRDYDRLCEQRKEIIYGSSNVESGMPHGSGISNPTERKAILLSQIESEISIIDKALRQIPPEYATYIFENIRYGYKCPSWVQNKDNANKNTWSRWRCQFIYLVAKYAGLV